MPVYGWDASNFTAVQRGDMHQFTRYLGPSRVALHPLQRSGAVSAASHSILGNVGAPHWPGLGDGPPAGHSNLTMPPVVPIAGSPRDPAFMI